jgi:hypothetical protein
MLGLEEHRDQRFPRGEAGLRVGTTSLGVEGLAAAVWALAAAFFLGFTAAGLGSVAAFDSGFFCLAVLLVAVTAGFLGATVTVRGMGFGAGVVVALTTRPLGLRDSTPRPGPSARQKARLAELQELYVDLRRRSFG